MPLREKAVGVAGNLPGGRLCREQRTTVTQTVTQTVIHQLILLTMRLKTGQSRRAQPAVGGGVAVAC